MSAASSCSPFRLIAHDYQQIQWNTRQLVNLAVCVDLGQVSIVPLTTFRFETIDMVHAFSSLRYGEHVGRYVALVEASSHRSSDCGSTIPPGQLRIDNSKAVRPANPDVTFLQMAICPKQHSEENRHSGMLVQLLTDGSLSVLQLNDPDHFNTFSMSLGEDTRHAVHHICAHSSLSSVVLQGVGPHFSVGGNPYTAVHSASITSANFALRHVMLYDGYRYTV